MRSANASKSAPTAPPQQIWRAIAVYRRRLLADILEAQPIPHLSTRRATPRANRDPTMFRRDVLKSALLAATAVATTAAAQSEPALAEASRSPLDALSDEL